MEKGGGVRETNLHAAGGWNLVSVFVPGDLRLREAADSWRGNHGAFPLRDRLVALSLLKTTHNYKKTRKKLNY